MSVILKMGKKIVVYRSVEAAVQAILKQERMSEYFEHGEGD